MQPPTSITLRAATIDDDGFMRAVYASTRAEEMKLVDWTDEQKSAFVEMQFQAQKKSYQNDYPDAQYFVILQDGNDAGRLILNRFDDVLLITDIALLPEYRGQAIGTYLIEELKNEARENNQCLRLHVENFNPAFRLYERLGFNKVAEHGFYWRMEWKNPGESQTQAA